MSWWWQGGFHTIIHVMLHVLVVAGWIPHHYPCYAACPGGGRVDSTPLSMLCCMSWWWQGGFHTIIHVMLQVLVVAGWIPHHHPCYAASPGGGRVDSTPSSMLCCKSW